MIMCPIRGGRVRRGATCARNHDRRRTPTLRPTFTPRTRCCRIGCRMMPGKVWGYRSGLCLSMLASLSALACAAPKQPAPRAPATAVVVNLERAPAASASEDLTLPALGDAAAPVTIVLLVAFDDVESAALYQSLSELQHRWGPRELRLVLVTRGAEVIPSRAELMGQALRRDAGNAAYFDFATRLFATHPESFGDTLKLALEVSRLHVSDTAPSKVESDRSALVVRAEADALLEAAGVPAFSVNGIHVLGHLPLSRLERLV